MANKKQLNIKKFIPRYFLIYRKDSDLEYIITNAKLVIAQDKEAAWERFIGSRSGRGRGDYRIDEKEPSTQYENIKK